MKCVDDWFTVEKIDNDTYVISEYEHWEETHCYLICGNQRAALIDTGLGVSNIRIIVEELTDLPIIVLTTHVHWDHIGEHGLFDLGDRKLQVIHTPGHSPGHCCYYEPERKYLYAGDLVYKGCLDIFYPTTNPIEFYASIKRIQQIPVKRILPGHHQLDIKRVLIDKIETGFSQLEEKGLLKQGTGIFDFEDFQIHI